MHVPSSIKKEKEVESSTGKFKQEKEHKVGNKVYNKKDHVHNI